MKLSDLQQKYILHWGEMGVRWGINRTMAQIQALLYLSPQPLDAEAICKLLGVARSNVSTSLRELQNWGIIKVVHVMGDRRDHFTTLPDVWEMFRRVLEERKKREIDPTLELLRLCSAQASAEKDRFAGERLASMRDFFETMSAWYEEINRLPTPAVMRFVKLGAKVRQWINFKT